ncbi:MAG TPA: hypothetical protein VKV74_06445 [Bryobacteraceae bacterium]|nr:hypothetical protein [Bryobacteraceae bacterium]
MTATTVSELLDFLARLRSAHIHYTLSDPTEGAIMVEVAAPGERWEIEFHGVGAFALKFSLA